MMLQVPFEQFFVILYDEVLRRESIGIHNDKIVQATNVIMEAYKKTNKTWINLPTPTQDVDYDDLAFRCAYLHKYAALHTSMVCEMLLRAYVEGALDGLINNGRSINMCSVGGGPGVDIVAFATFLELAANDFSFLWTTVLDSHSNWRHTFETILYLLQTGNYGNLDWILSDRNFQNTYLEADLLGPFRDTTHQAIGSADLITMIKFVSAVACEKTQKMLKNVFDSMKPGAIMLFIDNAAGGFHEQVWHAAISNNMHTIYGPLEHLRYENNIFRVWKYGYESLSGTRITVQFWRKCAPFQINTYETRHLAPYHSRIWNQRTAQRWNSSPQNWSYESIWWNH